MNPDVLAWVPLKRAGLFVAVTETRIGELQIEYPSVDVRREFMRPGGIRDWNVNAARGERKTPGKRGFWKHVHEWLDKEQKRAERQVRGGGAPRLRVVPGTVCECGEAKAEGAACCAACAEAYVVYVGDSLRRQRGEAPPAVLEPVPVHANGRLCCAVCRERPHLASRVVCHVCDVEGRAPTTEQVAAFEAGSAVLRRDRDASLREAAAVGGGVQ